MFICVRSPLFNCVCSHCWGMLYLFRLPSATLAAVVPEGARSGTLRASGVFVRARFPNGKAHRALVRAARGSLRRSAIWQFGNSANNGGGSLLHCVGACCIVCDGWAKRRRISWGSFSAWVVVGGTWQEAIFATLQQGSRRRSGVYLRGYYCMARLVHW